MLVKSTGSRRSQKQRLGNRLDKIMSKHCPSLSDDSDESLGFDEISDTIRDSPQNKKSHLTPKKLSFGQRISKLKSLESSNCKSYKRQNSDFERLKINVKKRNSAASKLRRSEFKKRRSYSARGQILDDEVPKSAGLRSPKRGMGSLSPGKQKNSSLKNSLFAKSLLLNSGKSLSISRAVVVS